MTSPPSTYTRVRRSATRAAQRVRRDRARPQPERKRPLARRPLARYTDAHGHQREVVSRRAAAGSVLVIDRDALTRGDRRLVAHLAADEPAENAALICGLYLEDAAGSAPVCRRVVTEDARSAPVTHYEQADLPADPALTGIALSDGRGCVHRLERIDSGMSIPELRWRSQPCEASDAPTTLSTREVIARLESYEPVRTLTLRALAGHGADTGLSTTVLRAELERVLESPIVLNRRLREVTLSTVASQELSMSEIAIRCGRVKRDSKGNVSGETSWLARRLGLLPEGGHTAPTPWVHSDVLALIARRGLGLSPREVELT